MEFIRRGATCRFVHIPVPKDVHERIKAEAKRRGVPATDVYQELLKSGARALQPSDRDKVA